MEGPQVGKIGERTRFPGGLRMSGLESVPSAYLSIGFLAVVGIIMPLTNFLITWVVRPKVDPARPHVTRSYLLEGYELSLIHI